MTSLGGHSAPLTRRRCTIKIAPLVALSGQSSIVAGPPPILLETAPVGSVTSVDRCQAAVVEGGASYYGDESGGRNGLDPAEVTRRAWSAWAPGKPAGLRRRDDRRPRKGDHHGNLDQKQSQPQSESRQRGVAAWRG